MIAGYRTAAGAYRNRLLWVLAITGSLLVVEVIGGILIGSLALLADAAHMFTDVAGISLALLATWIAQRPSTRERTFGLYRIEILAAALNAVLLLGVAALIIWEASQRLMTTPEIEGAPMLVVASLGLIGNAISLRLLSRAQAESLNMRGAYLEVLGDLLGSAAVLVAAAVIAATGLTAADPIASILVALLILPRSWSLLRDTSDVLLQATPRGVDLDEVRRHILETPGVSSCHDLHPWTLTSGMNVISAHVVLEERADPAEVLDLLCDCLSRDFDIEHSTFQLETRDRRRVEESTHA
jgi:cobalt-zinc-cadmium efflux system protein